MDDRPFGVRLADTSLENHYRDHLGQVVTVRWGYVEQDSAGARCVRKYADALEALEDNNHAS